MVRACLISGMYVQVSSRQGADAWDLKEDDVVEVPNLSTGVVSLVDANGDATIQFHGFNPCKMPLFLQQKHLNIALDGMYIKCCKCSDAGTNDWGLQKNGSCTCRGEEGWIKRVDGDGDAVVERQDGTTFYLYSSSFSTCVSIKRSDVTGMLGPDGSVTQFLEHIPLFGHVLQLTDDGGQQALRRHCRVTNTTSYVPLAGQVQAFAVEDKALADRSMVRGTATSVGALVAIATAGTASAAAATAGVLTTEGLIATGTLAGLGAAGNLTVRSTQFILEKIPGCEEKEVSASSVSDWLTDVAVGAAAGPICGKMFGGYKFGDKLAGVGGYAWFSEAAETTLTPASRVLMSEILEECGTELVAKEALKTGTKNFLKRKAMGES